MASPPPIRVLVVDDDERFGTYLRSLFDAEDDFEVVGEARDGREAVSLAADLQPDVVAMDLDMPRMGGAEATRLLRAASDRIQVLIVTSSAESDVEAARAFGAAARIMKYDVERDLVEVARALGRASRER